LNRQRSAQPGRRGEAGSVSVWAVTVVVAGAAMVGLVIDGGAILTARSDAFGVASGPRGNPRAR
jgi:hypothetical protein